MTSDKAIVQWNKSCQIQTVLYYFMYSNELELSSGIKVRTSELRWKKKMENSEKLSLTIKLCQLWIDFILNLVLKLFFWDLILFAIEKIIYIKSGLNIPVSCRSVEHAFTCYLSTWNGSKGTKVENQNNRSLDEFVLY